MYGATAAAAESARDPLQSIATDLNSLSDLVNQLRTRSGSSRELRDNLRDLRCQLKRKISEEQVRQSGLIERNSRGSVSDQQKRDLTQLQNFVYQLHRLMEEEQNYLNPPNDNNSRGIEEVDGGGAALLEFLPPANRAVESEVTAAALQDIQRDFEDLHQIQTELNRMVQEQGYDIDVIEANVEVAGFRVNKGRRALRDAEEFRGSSRRKKYCIVASVLVAAVVPIVLLAVLVPTLVSQLV